ncbi:lytic transglycosylase domain-containing protein [Nanoarchaeota archaeon]
MTAINMAIDYSMRCTPDNLDIINEAIALFDLNAISDFLTNITTIDDLTEQIDNEYTHQSKLSTKALNLLDNFLMDMTDSWIWFGQEVYHDFKDMFFDMKDLYFELYNENKQEFILPVAFVLTLAAITTNHTIAMGKYMDAHPIESSDISVPTIEQIEDNTDETPIEFVEVYNPANDPIVINRFAFSSIQTIEIIERVNQYDNEIQEAAKKYNLDPNLLKGLIAVESKGHLKAHSKYAKGLTQLKPSTAKAVCNVSNIFDKDQNIDCGARYLKKMLNRFENVDLALAAYNAGPTRVAKLGRIPNIKETKEYGPKVKSFTKEFKLYDDILAQYDNTN